MAAADNDRSTGFNTPAVVLCGIAVVVLLFAMALFIRHPDQWVWLRDNRDAIPNAVEEIVRAWPTTTWSTREALEVVEISGITIRAGETVNILVHATGTDPLTGSDSDKLSASIARHLKRYFDLHGGQLPPPGLYQRILKEMELPLIEIALDATGGNQAKCADLLGINRNTLRKKITDLDIRVTRRRKLM